MHNLNGYGIFNWASYSNIILQFDYALSIPDYKLLYATYAYD